MVLPNMAKWARLKGVDILSATDFTHPLWFRELRSQIEEVSDGLYSLKSEKKVFFLLSTEISSIYKQGDKIRRIHNLVFAPNLKTVEKINKEFLRRAFNLLSDGRPIIGLSAENLLELVLSIDPETFIIPCHVWTPHFGMYGSASGFDSMEESFGRYSNYIYGVETGLSSDPEMNWKIAELKNRSIVSFSDAHSLTKMGREATVFAPRKNGIPNSKLKIPNLSYKSIFKAIRRDGDSDLKIAYTIEFYPEEGKYHFSGHRNCKVVKGPLEIRKDGNVCPLCKKRLTEGVLYRVQQLSDKSLIEIMEAKISSNGIKWYIDKTKNHPPFVKLVPLLEILSEALGSTSLSQKTKTTYVNLCETFGSEIEVLLKAKLSEIEKTAGAKVSQAIEKVRRGNIIVEPGYDGEYGKVKIWNQKKEGGREEEKKTESQMGLF